MSSRLPAALRREQLLDVALHAFAEQGFHDTSMNDIAIAAGVTKPVLYQHFTSKRALFLELLQLVSGQLLDGVQGATAKSPSPRSQVEAGLLAYFQFVADSPDGYELLFGGGTRHDPEFAQETVGIEHTIASAIAAMIVVDGQPAPDRLILAHGIVGIAEGTARYWARHGFQESPRTMAQRVADLAWGGLRGIRAHQPSGLPWT